MYSLRESRLLVGLLVFRDSSTHARERRGSSMIASTISSAAHCSIVQPFNLAIPTNQVYAYEDRDSIREANIKTNDIEDSVASRTEAELTSFQKPSSSLLQPRTNPHLTFPELDSLQKLCCTSKGTAHSVLPKASKFTSSYQPGLIPL